MLTKVIKSYIEKDREHFHTAIPAKIIRYNAAKQRADVQPLVQERYLDNKVVDYPILYDVPLMFPSAGGGKITFPVKIDDVVLVIFSERSIDRWLQGETDKPIDPGDTRKHDLSDAIAIPGLYTFLTAPGSDPNDVVISFSGSSVKLKANGDVEFNPSGAVKVMGDVIITGSLTATGEITADSDGLEPVQLTTHLHGGVDTGGGFSGPPDIP